MPRKSHSATKLRSKILLASILLGLILVQLRLFYWQIIKGHNLRIQAQNQIIEQKVVTGERGRIFTAGGHLLVGNKNVFDLFVNKKELEIEQTDLVKALSQMLANNQNPEQEPSQSQLDASKRKLLAKLESKANWIKLATNLEPETKDLIVENDITGIYFQNNTIRYYPEASMAAHLTGFVGKNAEGQNTGYFGIEGALEHELGGDRKKLSLRQDALGHKMADQKLNFSNLDGRDVTLTINRDIQHLANRHLKQGLEQYQAKSGEVIVMDPQSGQLLALATWPHYDPAHYPQYETKQFKNPALANIYEPGSIFKTITVSAGIDSGVIRPDTVCSKCSGPRKIGDYTIKTWNDQYHPNITVSDALAKSDNVAMIFVAEQLGIDRFKNYVQKFGIGQKIDIDLQEDTQTPFPSKWGRVELATTSFGQGISANSLQMVRAVGAIANRGIMTRPTIVKQVFDPQTNETISHHSNQTKRIISSETAETVTKMMVKAAQKGEAQWIGKKYSVAGKTGTSQISSPDGGYKEDATIATFIGFAPPEDPKFLMLVKLVEPQTSPWAAETAVPLWFDIAEELFLITGIQQK